MKVSVEVIRTGFPGSNGKAAGDTVWLNPGAADAAVRRGDARYNGALPDWAKRRTLAPLAPSHFRIHDDRGEIVTEPPLPEPDADDADDADDAGLVEVNGERYRLDLLSKSAAWSLLKSVGDPEDFGLSWRSSTSVEIVAAIRSILESEG